MIKRFSATTIILLFLLLLCSCGSDKNENEDVPFYSTDETVYEIDTKYCELYYPVKWEEQINVGIDEEEPYTVKFTAVMDENEVSLFDLQFGGNEGYKLGTLTSDNQKVDIFIINHDFNQDDYDGDEYLALCGMCEDVNVIISKLIESGNFELAS